MQNGSVRPDHAAVLPFVTDSATAVKEAEKLKERKAAELTICHPVLKKNQNNMGLLVVRVVNNKYSQMFS